MLSTKRFVRRDLVSALQCFSSAKVPLALSPSKTGGANMLPKNPLSPRVTEICAKRISVCVLLY
jgi:hypothetical protein